MSNLDSKHRNLFSSKILLFGEYTVLHGSKALAMPFQKYSGKWIYDKNHPSRSHIDKLKQYLLKLYSKGLMNNFDFDELERSISKGLAFDSNIPQGYGVGSSGSVSAAIFDQFSKSREYLSIIELKDQLAQIESCFHGFSSGVDPLVSYLGQPILIHNQDKIELLDSVNNSINTNIYLLDTKIQRSTAPLVKAYLEMRRTSEEFLLSMQEIAAINDELIESYLLNNLPVFKSKIKELSKNQFSIMKMLIPDPYRETWQKGLDSGDYSVKLNGAGAGGFLMVYIHDESALPDLKSEMTLIHLA